jgi:hypothetical protein
MRLTEFDKPLNEAMPMGGLQKFGQTVRSKLPGTLGAATATGKLQTGQVANELAKGYYQFLGQLGEQPTPGNLLQYLTKSGYPTKMAIADLKKNVKATTTAPGAPLKEKAPIATRSLGLVPKDLALEPQEPSAPRRDVTNTPTTPTTPTSATKPTAVAKPGSIALVPINQKQVFSALTAVAREQVAGGTATSTNSTATPSSTPSSTPSAAPSTGPSLAKAFTAGLTGKAPPSDTATPRQINFQDPRSLNNLVNQINGFAKAGGKLDPTVKATLQKIITAL